MGLFLMVFVFTSLGLFANRNGFYAERIETASNERSFRVDYVNNQFLKDGKPFRFVGGSFHYFRAQPQRWREKLRAFRAAGLNAVTTYVEWFTHNPYDGKYVWDGIANVEEFIRLAAEEDLLVILRPGPYICAEREAGGFPHWLYSKYPKIKVRTNDPDYMKEVSKWYGELMPRFERYLYGNGGPIIMVQVENEYGAFGCDNPHKEWLRDETLKYVGDKAVLFTNDMKFENSVKCGKIENVLATVDFGIDSKSNIDGVWKMLRKFQPNGPLVNAEYYPGWFTHWHDPKPGSADTNQVAESLRYMLQAGASVNLYMFYGGTNFGFTAGTHRSGVGNFKAYTTSYDYDAPINEAGDITQKYLVLRDVIKDFLPLPNITVPVNEPKMQLPSVQLRPKTTLLSPMARTTLGSKVIASQYPLKFEELNQFAGFVLYETTLPDDMTDPSNLHIPVLNDRAIVSVDNTFVGILSRETLANTLPISAGFGRVLQILVENQGRNNFELHENEFKGIIGNALLNEKALKNWNITGFPFESFVLNLNELLVRVEQDPYVLNAIVNRTSEYLVNGPVIFEGTFDINEVEIYDTYVDPSQWGKGFILLNGVNLGRYWPLAGPQISLYLPRELLRKQGNTIVIVELQRAPKNGEIQFSNKPIYLNRN